MKSRFLCPICEHELTAKSYCKDCRKLIKEPLIYKGGALPNEPSKGYNMSLCQHQVKPNVDPHKQKNRTGRWWIAIVIIIVVCAFGLGEVIWNISELAEDKGLLVVETIEEQLDSFFETFEEETEDEDIVQWPVDECSGAGHYDIKKDEIAEKIYELLGADEEILEAGEPYHYSDHYTIGDTEYYYCSSTQLYIAGENGCINLEWDTLSERVHGVLILLNDKNQMISVFTELMIYFDGGLDKEDYIRYVEELIQTAHNDGTASMRIGNSIVRTSDLDGDLYIEITAGE